MCGFRDEGVRAMIKLLQLLNEASFTATPRELITTCVNEQTRVSFSSPRAEYYSVSLPGEKQFLLSSDRIKSECITRTRGFESGLWSLTIAVITDHRGLDHAVSVTQASITRGRTSPRTKQIHNVAHPGPISARDNLICVNL